MPFTASQRNASSTPEPERLAPTTTEPSAETSRAMLWTAPPGRSPRGTKTELWDAGARGEQQRRADTEQEAASRMKSHDGDLSICESPPGYSVSWITSAPFSGR